MASLLKDTPSLPAVHLAGQLTREKINSDFGQSTNNCFCGEGVILKYMPPLSLDEIFFVVVFLCAKLTIFCLEVSISDLPAASSLTVFSEH